MQSADVKIVDTITKLDPSHVGQVVIAGSHGGLYAGYCAAKGHVLAVILNDAGVGLDQAGIGSLEYLDELAIAAATADHDSCRIGNGTDMAAHGVVSHVNRHAEALGCRPGDRVADCARKMLAATPSTLPVPARGESRHTERNGDGLPRIVVMDSLSLVSPEDEGAILIAASHGALLGEKRETGLPVNVLAGVFCDAGVGKDDAGISRLAPLDERGIAAVTVSAESARIGDGDSVYETGLLSHLNRTAEALGATPGMTTRAFVDLVSKRAAPK